MRKQILYVTLPVCVAILVAGACLVHAGDLNPPPGPIEPTGRFGPRTEISDEKTPGDADSLFKITQPGSYYLAGNMTGVSGKSGIEIAADDVTLDLNGFALIGMGGSVNHGVSVGPGVKNLAVRNGTIRDWGHSGVGPQDLSQSTPIPTNGLFEDLRVSGNRASGLFVGENSRVINCGAVNNGADGFTIGPGSAVTNCTARDNSHNGFAARESCVLVNCTAVNNQGFSFSDGIDVASGSILRGCSARGNSANGIRCSGGGCVITGCTAVSNTLFGIKAPDSLLHANVVANNAGGSCDVPGSTVIENHGCP